jgi:hypothetical protein
MSVALVCRETGCGAFEWDAGHSFNGAHLAGMVTWRNVDHHSARGEEPQSGVWALGRRSTVRQLQWPFALPL